MRSDVLDGSIEVLHVGSNEDLIEDASNHLNGDELEIYFATSASDGLNVLEENNIDCVISDYDLQDTDGVKFLQRVRERKPELPFILYTEQGSEEVASKAISAGVTDYIPNSPGSESIEILGNSVRNAVDKYRTSRELETTLQKYERLVEQNIVGIYIIQDGVIKYFNPRCAEIFGYSQDEVTGMPPLELVADEDQDEVAENLRRRMDGEVESIQYSFRGVRKDGEPIYVEVHGGRVIYDGKPAVMGVLHDITDQKERHELYGTLVEEANDGVVVAQDGVVKFANTQIADIIDVTKEELSGKEISDYVATEDVEKIDDMLEHRDGKATERAEISLITSKGEKVPVELSIAKITYRGREASLSVIRDITARKERERELEEYRTLVENIGDPMFITDSYGVLKMVNNAFEKQLGYSRDYILGRNIGEIHSREGFTMGVGVLSDLLQDPEKDWETFEVWLEDVDGNERLYENNVGVLTDDDGNYRGSVGVIRDIMERKEHEQELERYETIVEASADGTYSLDPEGRYTFVNKALQELLGYSYDELVGEHVSFVMDEEDVETGEEIIQDLLKGDEHGRKMFEMDVITKSGEHVTVENHIALLPMEDGEFQGTVGITRDITERKEREQELERYEKFVQTSGDGMYALDREGRFTFVNETILEINGYTEDEMLGEPVTLVMDEEDVRRGEELIRELIKSDDRDKGTYEMDVITKDGRRRRVENHVALLTDEEGEFRGTVGVTRDIGERVERERDLERYKTMVDTIGDPMYALDSEGYITMVNDALVEQFGYQRDEIEGEHALKLMRPEDLEEGNEIIRDLLQDDDEEWGTLEMQIEDKSGNRRMYEDKIAVLEEEDEFVGSVGVIRDITDRRRREQQLQVLDRVLRHNLRNDMNVILGYLDVLLEELSDPDLLNNAKMVKKTGQELVDLSNKARYIEEILRSERDGRSSIDVVEILERQHGEFMERFPQADIKLDTPEEQLVYADKKLRIALEELIENALEHNDGKPEVRVSVLPSDTAGWVEIEVADNGPGIPEHEREVLEKGEETPLSHGSGFGLWLVNWIVKESNGDLEIRENEPRGSVVTVALPRENRED